MFTEGSLLEISHAYRSRYEWEDDALGSDNLESTVGSDMQTHLRASQLRNFRGKNFMPANFY